MISESNKKKLRAVKSLFWSARYKFPQKKLKIIGVTGTSGKSTTTNMIYHILNENGYKVGVISTLGAKVGNKIIDTGLHVTTPGAKEFYRILNYMVKKGMEYLVLETSSHALDQDRLGKVKFDYAVYTNIKRDHLDWHGSWEKYASAKAKLIDLTKQHGVIVINRGDKETYEFLTNYIKDANREDELTMLTYAMTELTDITETTDGIGFNYSDVSFFMPILGTYNVENALAAINVTQSLGLNINQIAKAFRKFSTLEGRMQVMEKSPLIAIIDFAHNADSLQKSLETARKLISSKNKIVVVFGSAGLRDVEKRYTMGEIAARYSDIVVITAEDPRTESLTSINDQIIQGAASGGGKLVTRFKNTKEYKNFDFRNMSLFKGAVFVFDEESIKGRYDAIEFALRIANKGDLVIAEGKGHEQSLCFGTTEYHFTDQEAMKKAIKTLKGE